MLVVYLEKELFANHTMLCVKYGSANVFHCTAYTSNISHENSQLHCACNNEDVIDGESDVAVKNIH